MHIRIIKLEKKARESEGKMRKVTKLLKKGSKVLQDIDLLKVLQSEITHELSTNRFQNCQNGSLGDFLLDWDSPKSEDVVLRRKSESGEEVSVSAILGRETLREDSMFPREALLKVCIRKPGLNSLLQFDCSVINKGDRESQFDVYNAYYLRSPSSLGSSIYRGPSFSTLDPALQDALKKYLVGKGIAESFTNFLICHLHKKEQGQYTNWLQKLEAMVAKGD